MARIDDTDRVFDVSRPHKVGPSATSKPVIVGHRPEMADPMVKEDTLFSDAPSKPPTPVKVWTDEDEKEPDEPAKNSWELNTSHDSQTDSQEHTSDELFNPTGSSATEAKEAEQKYTPLHSLLDKEDDEKKDEHDTKNDSDGGSDLISTLPLSHPPGAGPKKGKKLLWSILVFLVLAAGGYVAVDALAPSVKLPFEFFKEKEVATQPVITPPPPAQPVAPSVPTGFTLYEVEGTKVSFAYPTDWGTPTVTKEEGFTKRGGTNKSDGTYAYILNFATNKDMQVVLTSAKYLPATRAATYYDFLQWCVGTNDEKFYKEKLGFSTTDKVDTPTTTTCDQGPLSDATKVDETTVLQAKTKDPAGKDLGDLYTKNLTDKEFTVIRVKDTLMTNGDNVKKILSTVKVATTQSTSQ